MEKCTLEWRRLYVAAAQCRQGPCFSWGPLNYLSVVTDQFVDIFNVLPFLEGRTLQALLVAKIPLSALVQPKESTEEIKRKPGRRRLDEAVPEKDVRPGPTIVRCFSEKMRSERLVSCYWSPLMVPIVCITLNDGTVGIFEIDTSSSLIRAKAVQKKILVGPSDRATLCNFLPDGDLVTANGRSVCRWARDTFANKGDSRTGACKKLTAFVTAMDAGYYGYSDGSVWDNQKNMWESRDVPVSCIGVSSSVVAIAWGDLLGFVDLTRKNVKRQMDLHHSSLINSICVYGPQFCVVTCNGNVTLWDINKEMPKRFKAGPGQESHLQHGLTFRLHDPIILPCVGAALSPGGSLFAVCTSGDAVLVQAYYKQRHLGSSVEVWVTKNPMIDSVTGIVRQYLQKVPRPLSFAEFTFVDEDFVQDAELIRSLSTPERVAMLLETKQTIPAKHFKAFLAGRKAGKQKCFCDADTTLRKDLLDFTCPDGHDLPACVDSLTPIQPNATAYAMCDFCGRASQKQAQPGVCSFCLHRTTLLKMPSKSSDGEPGARGNLKRLSSE
eukprot:GEMP01032033.1.p1 GENE.GEMP01032033.1~~GEMP01032033.1.p1  ORF type:complete len:552 (+),score=103.69 GEMP01032033.1:89-1744(+)